MTMGCIDFPSILFQTHPNPIPYKKPVYLWSFSERRGAGVVERARLESVCTPQGYRGFESLSLRIKILDLEVFLIDPDQQ